MLLLTSASDKIHIAITSGDLIDAHASFLDHLGTVATPGRKNFATVAETDVDVVDPPGGGASRSVKGLHLRNRHASAPATVVVQHLDGVSTIELAKATLAAGEKLAYVEGQGFRLLDADGALK